SRRTPPLKARPRTAAWSSSSAPRRTEPQGTMSKLARAFQPNRVIDSGTTGLIVLFWAGTALLLWFASPWKTLPTPREIWGALGLLWWSRGMGPEMFSTLKLIAHAVVL